MKTRFFRLRNLAAAAREGKSSPAKLEESRNDKLGKLLRHAYDNVPFHRRRFRSLGLKPEDIRTPADLARLPVMSKEDLRDAPLAEIMAGNAVRTACVEVTTSGSTGKPLRIYYTREDFSRLNMNWLRPLLAHGVKPWHRRLEISGPHNLPGRTKWYQRMGFWRKRGVSIFNSPDEWIKAWREYRPEILYGYSGSLKLLARFALEHRIEDIRPRFVFGVSDQADEEGRELAAKAFRQPLIDLYGAAEGGCIAWECPDGNGYHINADTVIVEFLQDNLPVAAGERGTIVITNLHSFAMPVIRYELGDIGVSAAGEASGGRSLPLMRGIEGRTDAQILLPSGSVLSPMFFFGVMKTVKEVRDWRVVQDRAGRVTVYTVPTRDFPVDGPARLKTRVEEKIGERFEVDVALVEKIPPDPSGKLRAVISLVEPGT
ncbi:MAG: hypothetical protein P9M08_02765 [Candidatus Erginobacter occultus]|nr:hypothetical protein [Candidatus Erginobacter occultus]